jgi:hypothetical protein
MGLGGCNRIIQLAFPSHRLPAVAYTQQYPSTTSGDGFGKHAISALPLLPEAADRDDILLHADAIYANTINKRHIVAT